MNIEISRELLNRLDVPIEELLSAKYKKWLSHTTVSQYTKLLEAGLMTHREYVKVQVAKFYTGYMPRFLFYSESQIKSPEQIKSLDISYLDVSPALTTPDFDNGTFVFKKFPDVPLPLNVPNEDYLIEMKTQYYAPMVLYTPEELAKYIAKLKGWHVPFEEQEQRLLVLLDTWLQYGVTWSSLSVYLDSVSDKAYQEAVRLINRAGPNPGASVSVETVKYLARILFEQQWGGPEAAPLTVDPDVTQVVACALQQPEQEVVSTFKNASFKVLQRFVVTHFFKPLYFQAAPVLSLEMKLTDFTPESFSVVLSLETSSLLDSFKKKIPIPESELKNALVVYYKYSHWD